MPQSSYYLQTRLEGGIVPDRTEENAEVGQFRFEVCGWVSSVYWGDAFYTNLDACLLHVWGRESFTAGITGIVLRKPDDHR